MENLLWQGLFFCLKTEYGINEQKDIFVKVMIIPLLIATKTAK